MKNPFKKSFILILTVISLLSFHVRQARGCACGCGVFDVGTDSMIPNGPGGMAFVEYDYQDQNRAWTGHSKSSLDANNDKEIRTKFITAGVQYMLDRSWGFEAEVPFVDRTFTTTGGASGSDITSMNWGELGDMRVRGIYTGFSPDMSTGLNFGLKLPTGNYTRNDSFGTIDRDTEIGSGSTDVLLGGYHRQALEDGHHWNGFAQFSLDMPVVTRDEYRPGLEVDASLGVYYEAWKIGKVHITPMAQVIGSERMSDGGVNSAHPVASGYQRILASPGLEIDIHPFIIYGDVEIPVYQYMIGTQLTAPALFKVIASYHF